MRFPAVGGRSCLPLLFSSRHRPLVCSLRLVGAGVESQSRGPMIGLLRQGQAAIRHLEKTPRRVVSGGLRESARDPEPVVEDERVVARVVPGPSHLDDPQLSLHPELTLSREPEVQDSVHEIVFLVLRVRGSAGIRTTRAVCWQLSEEERRALEVPKPADEGEHFPPRLAELREDLERIERVEDEEPVVERLADPLRVEFEQVEPRLVRRSRQLLPQRAQVEDAQVSVGIVEPVAEAFRVVDQARPALLERDVQPARPVQGARVQDMVGERGLHRARCAGDEDDIPFWDSASEDLVESLDVRRDSLHFSSSTISSEAAKSSSISLPFQYSAAVTRRSGCASDAIREGHSPRATSSAPWAANERKPLAAASS